MKAFPEFNIETVKKLPIASHVDQFLLKGLLILQGNGDAFGVGCRGIFIWAVDHYNGKNGESNFAWKQSPAACNFGSANVTPQLFTTVFIALSLAHK